MRQNSIHGQAVNILSHNFLKEDELLQVRVHNDCGDYRQNPEIIVERLLREIDAYRKLVTFCLDKKNNHVKERRAEIATDETPNETTRTRRLYQKVQRTKAAAARRTAPARKGRRRNKPLASRPTRP